MAAFNPAYPLALLRGADYNPRRIDEASLETLRHSLAKLGVAKPIIVSNGLIVAGHQRTKALRAIGCETAPVVLLDRVSKADEIRFNQLHNGTDLDSGDEAAEVGPAKVGPLCFEDVPARDLRGNMRARMATVRKEICVLLTSYGNWGACVATASGRVIHAAQYTLACKAMGIPCRVYRVPQEIEEEARALLGRQYGVFSYNHLARETYIQTFAQPMRLRKTAVKITGSRLYDTLVMPRLRAKQRILDFGCGQADYVKALSAKGVDIKGVEFFFRNGHHIDTAAVHRMIAALAEDLEARGRFDIVVADSVLNSVDTLQAESDVLTCISAFCRPGGTVYFSGRAKERLALELSATKKGGRTRNVEFLDEDGFSGTFRNGNWFYQKFHSKEEVGKLARKYFGDEIEIFQSGTEPWMVKARKRFDLPAEQIRASLGREFNLMWPAGRSVNRASLIQAAWEKARSGELQTASSGKS